MSVIIQGLTAGDERDRWKITVRPGNDPAGEAYYVYGIAENSDPEQVRNLGISVHGVQLFGEPAYERMPVPIVPESVKWWQRHLDNEDDNVAELAFAQAQEAEAYEPPPAKSGDFCRLVTTLSVPASEHYRCDEYADGTITNIETHRVIRYAQPGAPIGFDR